MTHTEDKTKPTLNRHVTITLYPIRQLGIVDSVDSVDFNSFLAFFSQKTVETVNFNSFPGTKNATFSTTLDLSLTKKKLVNPQKNFCAVLLDSY